MPVVHPKGRTIAIPSALYEAEKDNPYIIEIMEEVKDKKEMKKTQVFNVIILDRSGSMECIRQAAVEGFNETLAGIKKRRRSLPIRNSRNFAHCNKGTLESIRKDTGTRMNFFSRLSDMKRQEADGCSAPISAKERHNLYTNMADKAFDEEEEK